jgi:2-polyprenyl-3-methyl-5-hydroxy-6-metoxy-1,4-benzoquinol methylase
MFKPRLARRALERYRSRGLDHLDRHVLAAASAGGVEGAKVLEIGGGIGAIQSELLDAGAGRGEIVEVVSAWRPYAAELAQEKGQSERSSFRIADVLEAPEAVEQADVVVLNRVVCCSPDGVELARSAARLTRRTLVLSFPRNALWLRFGARLLNASFRVLGRSYRLFLHPPSALAAAAGAEGLTLEDEGRTFAWEYMGFRRRS